MFAYSRSGGPWQTFFALHAEIALLTGLSLVTWRSFRAEVSFIALRFVRFVNTCDWKVVRTRKGKTHLHSNHAFLAFRSHVSLVPPDELIRSATRVSFQAHVTLVALFSFAADAHHAFVAFHANKARQTLRV